MAFSFEFVHIYFATFFEIHLFGRDAKSYSCGNLKTLQLACEVVPVGPVSYFDVEKQEDWG